MPACPPAKVMELTCRMPTCRVQRSNSARHRESMSVTDAPPSLPPPSEPAQGSFQASHLLGLFFAVVSSLLTTIGLLIQKHSARVEAGKPVCRRWRFWVGFWLNTGSELSFSILALAYAPNALIAPVGGITVIFNALLTRFGLVCGIRERMGVREWLYTTVILAGVIVVASSGPGSVDGDVALDVEQLPPRLAQPAFVVIACVSFVFVVGWLLIQHLPSLKRYKPPDSSLVASLASGSTAACCGAMSVTLLKIISSYLGKLFCCFTMPHPVEAGSLVILVIAPLQLYLLNLSLAAGQATFAVPLYVSLLMVLMSVFGGIVFGEYAALLRSPMPLYIVLYVCGIALVICGLFGLSMSARKREQQELSCAGSDASFEQNVKAVSPDTEAAAPGPAAAPRKQTL